MSQNLTLTPGFLLISERDNLNSASADQFISQMRRLVPMAKGRSAQLFGMTRNNTLRVVEVWDKWASWSAYLKDVLMPIIQQSGMYPSRVIQMDAFNTQVDPRVSSGQVSNASGYIIDVPFATRDDYLSVASLINPFPAEMVVHAVGFTLEGQLRVVEIWTDDAQAQHFYTQELPGYFKRANMTKQAITSAMWDISSTISVPA